MCASHPFKAPVPIMGKSWYAPFLLLHCPGTVHLIPSQKHVDALFFLNNIKMDVLRRGKGEGRNGGRGGGAEGEK